MKNYRELYDRIENPLDKHENMMKLITAYAKSSKEKGGLYNQLIKTSIDTKKYIKGEYYQIESDYFYSMLFNKWKNSIVNISKERFLKLRQQGSYDNDFIELRSFLKTIPDIKTEEEAKKIFFGEYNNQVLEGAMERYKWSAFGQDPCWTHVCSRYLTAKKDEYPDIAHRLYINTESIDTYKMLISLMEKFDKYQLPYYFKFDRMADRDDTIVIYSDNKNLSNYIKILQEIQKEKPDLVSRIKAPPVLTGKIDGWIGYGSEPEVSPSGKLQSFNDIRAKILETAMGRVTKQWIMAHRNMNIIQNKQKITFEDYIVKKATNIKVKKIDDRYSSIYKGKTDADVAKIIGYSLSDLRSPQFKQLINDIIKKDISKNLTAFCTGKLNDIQRTKINLKNGYQIKIDEDLLNETIQEFALEIAQHDKSFISNVRQEIDKEAKKHGVDINKFCFDIKNRDSLFAIDKLNEHQHSKENSNNYDNNVYNKRIGRFSIVNYLNPTLMKKMIQLPNGETVSTVQYIQKVVSPHIPRNGKFILKNGVEMSAQQFIEENILSRRLILDKDDIVGFLNATTKANNGIIDIDGKKINSIQITKILNPALMTKKVNMPSGETISATQYIQEVVAPQIPTLGSFLLKDGSEMPAKQFIEQIVLPKGQRKFGGDIFAILNATTKANDGTIEIQERRGNNPDPNTEHEK